ncbi:MULTISPECIES: nucleoside-diphosphate kinase [Dehalobacter]|uniref:Nucleoside diphosphate kinase n=2 Tax=Dehalobacter restrictus TaxID=55583 RepID=A0A857DFB3_9FIRM|nr:MULTISPECIES: nucleoside-diphosphate kinase [Dehalobacter]AHF08895.1 nucleoside diphosphate kinase [Dehalobacter restrictus DSM 9455]MCG1025709.1 nucleoside-diphosphate kinase [Dehalobacter sp.]OCZ50066.1 nucleoside-diphosphate kinase [Dehalobacter sp. TeCB1]QGZ99390.1 nucleoside-diphosphate kinase [Dehalobacter restrictus]
MERTFLMLKPDAIQRGLVGEVIGRFEKKGFKLVGLKLIQVDRALAEEHYKEHKGKGFFEPTVQYIMSSPVVAMVWEGKNVVAIAREMMGATNPANANPGSIRGAYAMDISRNVIHGSDSVESAEREISLYFKPAEILHYAKAGEEWLSE